jgi:HEAT repeat protein
VTISWTDATRVIRQLLAILWLAAGAAGAGAVIANPSRLADASDEVEKQFHRLYSADASERCKAADELSKLGAAAGPAVPKLIRLLADEHPFRLPDNGLDGPFFGYPFECAVEALYNIGEPAVLPLIRVLKHSNARVRARAVDALGRMGDTRAVIPLRAAFSDRDVWVRRSAVLYVRNRDPRLLDSYTSALKDRDSQVRLWAARNIGSFDDPRVFGVLIAALRSTDVDVRLQAAMSLGSLRDVRAIPALLTSLTDTHEAVRAHSALALGELGETQAIEPLLAALRADPDMSVRFAAAEALGKLGDGRAVDPLIATLGSDNFVQRKVAATALGRLGDARAIEPLTALLNDEQHVVQDSAREALAALREKAARQPQ